MTKITFPLEPQMRGPEVDNLQAVLELLLDRRAFLANDEAARRDLSGVLQQERARHLYGDTTQRIVSYFQEEHRLPPHGSVDEPTANALNAAVDALPPTLIVSGRVSQADGSPLTTGRVYAWDRDLRSREPLGDVPLGEDGRYEIHYTADMFARAEKGSADLWIEVFDANQILVAESKTILYHAEPIETINLGVGGEYRGPSEYDELLKELAPVLQDVPLSQLNESDIEFLANETRLDRQHITWLVRASTLEDETRRIDSPIHTHIVDMRVPATAFYAWLRQGLPVDLPALLARDTAELRRTIEASIHDNVIPLLAPGVVDEIMARIAAIKTLRVLQPAGENERASFGDLVSTVISNPDRQRLLADLFVSHSEATSAFWQAISERPEFSAEDVKQVRRTLELGALTGNHLPLVRELQGIGQADPALGQLRGLARFEVDDWREVLQRRQANGEPVGFPADTPGADDPAKIANYARMLGQFIQSAFPTAVVAERLKKDAGADSPFKPVKESLQAFFDHNPAFELRAEPLDLYLLEDRDTKLAGVAADQVKEMTASLKGMQRLSKITADYGQMRTLLADDLHSSQAILNMGQREFVERHHETFQGEERARAAYQQAEQIHSMALMLYARHSVTFNDPLPDAIAGNSSSRVLPMPPGPANTPVTPRSLVASATPDVRTLFGSLDLCDCEHCRSMYSPAAYLVDTLKFLKEGPRKDGKTPLDVLSDRRPDLAHIELTCENTDTRLPYVDLVEEVLENAIAPFEPFVILPIVLARGVVLWRPKPDLDQKILSPQLRDGFASRQITLGPAASVEVATQGTKWVITDHSQSYTVISERGLGDGVRVMSENPQTGGTADELSANPEHVHAAPYNALAGAVYPWSLPFNRWVEEAQVYLGHLGVRRHEVMDAFFTGAASARPADPAIAAEYLGLTKTEAGIITHTITHDSKPVTAGGPADRPWDFWGLPASNPDPTNNSKTITWNAILARVDVLLQQSGLSYLELLDLLDTYFVNPSTATGRALSLESASNAPGDTAGCDLNRLLIKGLDGAALGRMHRFARLWRKLGWTMRDLDRAITALKPTDLNDTFLVQLSHIQRLHVDLNLPVVTLLSWWAPIDTASYIEHAAEGQPPVQSLYERLFLNRAVISPVDETFKLKEPARDELADTTGKTSNAKHTPVILAALGVSAADLALVLEREFTDAQGKLHDELNLAHLSHLYRLVSISKALRLPVRDLLTLRELMIGANPFDTPQAGLRFVNPFDSTEHTLEFIARVRKMRASSLSISQLDYLLRNRSEGAPGIAPSGASTARLLDEIRLGLQKIAAENTFAPDPKGELTRDKLVTLEPLMGWQRADIDGTIALLAGTTVYSTSLAPGNSSTITLPSAGTDKKIWYGVRPGTKIGLGWTGAMSEGERGLLLSFSKDSAGEAGDKYRAAVETLFDRATGGQTVTVPLETLPALKISDAATDKLVYNSQTRMLSFTGVMTQPERALLRDLDGSRETEVNDLFDAPRSFVAKNMESPLDPSIVATLLDEGASADSRFGRVLARLLAFDRGESFACEKLGETFKLESPLARLLLEQILKSDTNASGRMLEDLLALGEGALSATYYKELAFKGAVVKRTDGPVNYGGRGGNVPPPGVGLRSAIWTGKVRAAKSEEYTFHVRAGGRIRLQVDNQVLIDRDSTLTDLSAAIELRAGQIYDIELKFSDSNGDGVLVLSWSSPSTPKAIIPQSNLYPGSVFDAFVRLHKAALLINGFGMTVQELQYLAGHGQDFAVVDVATMPPTDLALDLDALLQTPSPYNPASFGHWERLSDVFTLTNTLPKGETGLTDLFAFAAASSAPTGMRPQTLQRLAQVTGWNPVQIDILTGAGGFALTDASLRDERALLRLQACLRLSERLGVSTEILFAWASHQPDEGQAREIKNTVKAKYDDKEWLEVARPLKDVLRERQRAALVAYLVVHPDPMKKQTWSDTSELYEYFLIDVEMDPCTMTTRIKQAISSVQLFIQRSLMNLEQDPAVSLTPGEAKAWREWRKQYRVWEANRKVFLYPENWIEPELRDDKSPFFKDLENELLQNDVTMDTAETAFVHYLDKLDEVARLESVGMYQQKEAATDSQEAIDILHVFGRTFAIPHIYYYRRLESSVWSAWGKVDLDIEGDHLLPVVWNRRLHLFWPIFTEKARTPTEPEKKAGSDPEKYWEIKLAWSHYKNGAWSAKKVSPKFLESPDSGETTPPDKSAYIFRSLRSPFAICCYCRVDSASQGPVKMLSQVRNKQESNRTDGGTSGDVVELHEYSVSGVVFVDTNGDGNKQSTEPRISGVTVRMGDIRTTTDRHGEYTIELPSVKGSAQPEGHVEIYPPEGYYCNTGKSVKPLWTPTNPEQRVDFGMVPTSTVTKTTSVVPVGMFRFVDSTATPSIIRPTDPDFGALDPIQVPYGTHVEYMQFEEESGEHPFGNFAGRGDPVLGSTPGTFRLLAPHQDAEFTLQSPLFYQDDRRTYFVSLMDLLAFHTFYHPYVSAFVKQLNRYGIEGLLAGYNQRLTTGDHFYAVQAPGWDAAIDKTWYKSDGVAGFVFQTQAPGTVPLYRLCYGPIPHHFYTASTAERDGLITPGGYQFEAIAGYVFATQAAGTVPFYRLYSETGDHLFTASVAERDAAVAQLGYRYEDISCYVFPTSEPGTTPLYRFVNSQTVFQHDYQPSPSYVGRPYPIENIDFEYEGSYSLYNWELFFHAPFLIATRLTRNQRFEEAQKWFHYIFDPTSSEPGGPEQFWRVQPFYAETKQGIQTLDDLMKEGKKLEEQMAALSKNPFKPHVIARLRVVAYMKAVVMKYIDNLIAWGDQLFRRDTIESINEATQLYILAAHILGKRPEEIPPRAVPETQTFHSLDTGESKLNALANAMVEIEHYVFPSGAPANASRGGASGLGQMWLFCMPKNDKLLGYWSTVADRLFKIRHCMNIEGIVRQLPTFEPPIDPALLVRAAAAGVDISSALNDINAPLPHYRFNVMLQKAAELCNDVKMLGGALLAALEKRDAEGLALLRSRHEIKLLGAVRQIREQQITESENTLEGLCESRNTVQTRYEYYRDIVFMTEWEKKSLGLMGGALLAQIIGSLAEVFAVPASSIPDVIIGVSGIASPVATVKYGGTQAGNAASSVARFSRDLASILNAGATMSSTYGSYWRRWDDWKLQEKLASKELGQLDKQILAAEIRVAIAGLELKNHDLQVENAKEVDAFMRDKYTNQELYDWMLGQVAGLYFQSYQMAYDIARQAERCFRYELGLSDSSYIQFGYWDSLKKGLLSGEKLHYDLKRMEVAYLEQNRREYEMTRHVSLLQLDPLALVQLRETGQCTMAIPEALFDMDGPGHYFRRIKTVALSIPCVTGPYSSINCTLTLQRGTIRKSEALLNGTYARTNEDARFVDDFASRQSIVTSSSQNDSGLFETNLRDERFLPFEGAGVESEWRLQLPANPSKGDPAQFDYKTISDVILHVRYTARDGGSELRQGAVNRVRKLITEGTSAGSMRLFSVRHEFPAEWARFQNQTAGADQRFELALALREEHYPFWSQGRLNSVTRVEILARSSRVEVPPSVDVYDKASDLPEAARQDTLKQDAALGNLLVGQLSGGKTGMELPTKPDDELRLFFDDKAIADLWIAVTWSSNIKQATNG